MPVRNSKRKPAPRDYDDVMKKYRAVYNSDTSFLGVDRADWSSPRSYRGADVVIVGAPFDGGTSFRPGARFGPQAIRRADYLPMVPYRPHLDLGVDAFSTLTIVDAGDVPMPPGEIQQALALLENCVHQIATAGAIPIVLGGDHSIALPDMRGVARHHGKGSFAVIHFDAHADTGDTNDFGSRYGHGTPMRRLIDDEVVDGQHCFQLGLRGYWPGPGTLGWARKQGLRWYTMDEIGRRGLDACLEEVLALAARSRGVFLSIDIDVVDPAMAPGTGTPEPGGLSSRALLDAVRRCATSVPLVGMDVVEVSPPYDAAGQITAALANRVVLEALSGLAWRRLHPG